MITDNDKPLTYQDAMNSSDSKRWLEAMKSEMESMYQNKVLTLVDPLEGVKPIGCKWVFKKKTDMDGKVQTHKGNLSGYFEDIHGGIFTLTAYDDVCVYLYTFKISRHRKDLDYPMVVKCDILSRYQIKFSSLSLGTCMLSVASCFPSSPNPQAINLLMTFSVAA
ncbi:hypothetical protein AgCh_030751 [Apium graveolens]